MLFVPRSLFAAIGFLTALPVPSTLLGGEKELGASKWFFPIIGLCIGALAAYFDVAMGMIFESPILTNCFTLVFLIAISKALHLDGLADTADGFLSSRPRDRMLEIMKDSRTGVMGVTAIVSLLMLKFGALTSLDKELRMEAIWFAPIAGRTALLIQMNLLSYARSNGGLATVFMAKRSPVQLLFALAFVGASGYWLLGVMGLAAAGATLVLTLLFAVYCYRKIGGLTGDTLGAGAELSELTALLAVVALAGLVGCQSPSTPKTTEAVNEDSPSCERIVSLAPNITETAFALGLGDRLIGVTSFCNYPPEAKSKPVIGDFVNPNYEILSTLRPDVVLLLEHHEIVAKRLSHLGIRSHSLTSLKLDDVLDSIRSLGQLCDVEKRALELTASIEKKIKGIEQKTKNLKRPKVLVSVGRSMGSESIKDIYAAGKGSLFDEVVYAAGGQNAFSGNAISYARMSAEGVLELNPDVIIDLVVDLKDKGIDKSDVVAQWNVVARTNAVKNGRVHVLSNDYVVIPGPRIVLLVEELARLFHPEVNF